MVTIKQLEAFYWAYHLKSFVAAAAKLNTTQSNISKRVQELEWSMRDKLFERGKTLNPTFHGKRLLPMAEDVLQAFTRLQTAIDPTSLFSGIFRLGASETVAMSWLPALLAELRRQFPHMVVEPQIDAVSELHRRLLLHEIDLVLGSVPADSDELTVVPLASEELVWVCHPHLYPGPHELELEEIAKLPIIEHASGTKSFSAVSRMFRDAGIRPNTVSSCSSMVALEKLVSSGLGITHLPRYLVQSGLESKRLREIRCKTHLPKVFYAASFRKADPNPVPSFLAKIALDCCVFKA